MIEIDACTDCGVLDALSRHDPMCGRAIQYGLPRLAEGEQPIDPVEYENAPEDDGESGEIADGEPPPLQDRPGAIERAPKLGVRLTELWISYRPEIGDVAGFDATVFETELDALRHAVETGAKVRRLELGRSLRKQVEDAPS
jgi:hypothetical protein